MSTSALRGRPPRPAAPASASPTFAELFTPKLLTVLREGYGLVDLRADALAGLTVAIVALPLSMAIAIASGVGPERGLFTAVAGGLVVSLLGGSRFQIGGPAGAFIVLVAATVARHGPEGLTLATAMAGLVLLAAGFLRLGTYIRYIPYPVTVGFTAGIAVIIAVSQLKELLGLALAGPEPGPIVPKLAALARALPTASPAAAAVAALTIAAIVLVRRLRPRWPAFLIAAAGASAAAWLLGLRVETIASRFGGIPASFPAPHLPPLSPTLALAVLPDALAFALLGGIESLLSAVVADSMTGRRHRSSCELVAQGAANLASALFGGITVTGAIARTATNVRAGARGPVAGMLHAAFLLIAMLVAAPLAGYVPLAALAAVLVVVAWNMAERHEVAVLLRASRGDAVVLLATFLLTVFRDLTEGILAGSLLGTLLFLHRMAESVQVESGLPPLVPEDRADAGGGDGPGPYDPALATDPGVTVHAIRGALFFGAAASVAGVLDRVGEQPRAHVLDLTAVPLLDSTAAAMIAGFARKAGRQGARVYVVVPGASPMRRALLAQGVRPPGVRFRSTLAGALRDARGDAAPGSSSGVA